MVWFALGLQTCSLNRRSVGICLLYAHELKRQEALPLTVPSHNKTDEVSITCLDFPDSETATFWIGTEEGSVYQANRYDRASAKAGLNSSADDIFRGHAGPVTGLQFHPSSGSIDFSDLFLTSSVDWTVKLWRTRGTAAAKNNTDKAAASSGIAPIHSFEEADDYVFDVKWHPNHPAMFGTVDGSGKFDLWNLNKDAEVSAPFHWISADRAGADSLNPSLVPGNQQARVGQNTLVPQSWSRLKRRQTLRIRRRGKASVTQRQ
jgi:WD40 repeat protein